MLPLETAAKLESGVESRALAAIVRFYKLAKVLYAPNEELCEMLERRTGKPCHLMQRGVDTQLFNPARRTRGQAGEFADNEFVLGYVGRLSIEKNVALLPRIERQLEAMGITRIRFLIVGHGDEEAMLRRELHSAHFAGVLRGEALATAYANMDALVFPSHTDTFGNVVLEALASGVPAVVTPDGGPKFVVRDGETGFVMPDERFADAVANLVRNSALAARMRDTARAHALTCSWDAVFDQVLAGYALEPEAVAVHAVA